MVAARGEDYNINRQTLASRMLTRGFRPQGRAQLLAMIIGHTRWRAGLGDLLDRNPPSTAHALNGTQSRSRGKHVPRVDGCLAHHGWDTLRPRVNWVFT